MSTVSFNIDQIDLSQALQALRGSVGVGKRVLTAYDTMLYLEVSSTPVGRELCLRVTSMGDFKDVRIPVTAGVDGVFPLVTFEDFYQIVGTIPMGSDILVSEDVDANQNKTGNVSVLYAGRQTPIVFAGVQSLLFPLFPNNEATEAPLQIAGSALTKSVGAMNGYIHETASNAIFSCMNIQVLNNSVKAQGIDDKMKRFAYIELGSQNPVEGSFMVEASAFKRAYTGFDDSQSVTVYHTIPSHVILEQGSVRVALRNVVGTFPPIEVHTHRPPQITLTFDRIEMLRSLDRIRVFVDDSNVLSRVVQINFNNGVTTIDLTSSTGRLQEAVSTTLNGAPFSLNFLVDSLHHAIRNMDTPQVSMLVANTSGGVLQPIGSQLYDDHRVLLQAIKQP